MNEKRKHNFVFIIYWARKIAAFFSFAVFAVAVIFRDTSAVALFGILTATSTLICALTERMFVELGGLKDEETHS